MLGNKNSPTQYSTGSCNNPSQNEWQQSNAITDYVIQPYRRSRYLTRIHLLCCRINTEILAVHNHACSRMSFSGVFRSPDTCRFPHVKLAILFPPLYWFNSKYLGGNPRRVRSRSPSPPPANGRTTRTLKPVRFSSAAEETAPERMTQHPPKIRMMSSSGRVWNNNNNNDVINARIPPRITIRVGLRPCNWRARWK